MRLGMIGGVKSGGGYWQSLDGKGTAHRETYVDYSQLYREFTHERKAGYVVVGERDGRTVYAAPDCLRTGDAYTMVSAAAYKRIAAERGALIPTRDEIKTLYAQCRHITMPTQPIWKTGGSGDPVAYTRAVDAVLKGIPDGTPVAHGKEFYAID